MESLYSAFPHFLKAADIADAMQVSPNTAYDLMRRSGLVVHCGVTGKSLRVPRDKFFQWVHEQAGQRKLS